MNVLNALSAKIHRVRQSLGLIGWALARRLIGPALAGRRACPIAGCGAGAGSGAGTGSGPCHLR